MMKRLMLLSAALPLLLASCDNVSEDDRYIETGPVEVSRKVLLEEFTGQRCVNCPDAHRIIESLEEQYGEDLVVVSIHAGTFGIKAPVGLKQTEGDEYAQRWNVTAYPAGVVDRTGSVMNMDQWSTAIRNEIGKETDLQLSLSANVSSDGKNIEVFTTMVTPEPINGSLQLWVIESGIVAPQLDGDETRTDYVHNNVFRTCVNGLWGQEVSLKANDVEYVSNTVAIDDKWNLNNVEIVGFVYNGDGVVQVEKCKL